MLRTILIIIIFLTFSKSEIVLNEKVNSSTSFDIPSNKDSIYFHFSPIQVQGRSNQKINEITSNVINSKSLMNNNEALSINNGLRYASGVYVLNNENFSQDTRLSIRGIGLRSPFGIRGVKVFVDGVPESTPDGQCQLDNLDINNISQIEVFKSSSTGPYGNASGAVINFISYPKLDENKIKINSHFGSFNKKKINLQFQSKFKGFNWYIRFLQKSANGYRDNSSVLSNSFNIGTDFKLSKNQNLSILINGFESPFAFDPGSLTIEQVMQDRTMSNNTNKEFKAGEFIFESKLSLIHNYQINKKLNIKSYSFILERDFNNKLPFEHGGQVDLQRDYFGVGSNMEKTSPIFGFESRNSIGVEILSQNDLRKRFKNEFGERGDLTFRQTESYKSFGIYFKNKINFGANLSISSGLRSDLNIISFTNRFLNRAQDKKRFLNISPTLNCNLKIVNYLNLYYAFSKNFETPTLYELGNDPDNPEGMTMNSKLKPQDSYCNEIGFTTNNIKKFKFKTAYFQNITFNEIVAFEIESTPGRSYFRNAGRTLKNGIELEVNQKLGKSSILKSNYTFSKFEFRDYILGNNDIKGNSLPLIPQHFGYLELEKNEFFKFTIITNIFFQSNFFADDLNKQNIKGHGKINIKIKLPIRSGSYLYNLTIGVNNVLNVKYYDNIRVNAWGKRYFEPAPGRHFNFGFSLFK